MKKSLCAGLIGMCLSAAGWAATDPVYENYGTVSTPPQVDATVFLNSGLFDVTGAAAVFDTQDTLYFTNSVSGVMSSFYGFDFRLQTNGFHYPALVVDNRGTVDGGILNLRAERVVNHGILDGTYGGIVKIEGSEVDLSRGGLRADQNSAVAAYNTLGTQIYYVGLGTNNVMSGPEQTLDLTSISGDNPVSPSHDAVSTDTTGRYTVTVPFSGDASGFTAIANSNSLSSTSYIVQVIFVSTNLADTNVTFQAGFLSGGRRPARAIVQWSLPDVDVVDGQPFTNFVTLLDNLGNVETNLFVTNRTYLNLDRTENFSLTQGRYTPYRSSQITNNIDYDDALLIPEGTTNTVVTNTYAAWYLAVGQDTLANPGSSSSGGGGGSMMVGGATGGDLNPALNDVTNATSRIEISAGNLDLSNTRIRSGTILTIGAKHLVSNEGFLVDTPVVRWNIGSTNGTLVVSNLTPVAVSRIVGTIQAYSTVWTNTQDVVGADGATNSLTVMYHALFLDHALAGVRTVQVYDVALHATNLVVHDNLKIYKKLTLDAESLDLLGSLSGDALATGAADNFARLNSLTNQGSITMGATTPFTLDAATPMANFVNRGALTASGVRVRAEALQNSGTVDAGSGSVAFIAAQAKLDGGTLTAGGDVTLAARELKVRGAQITGSALSISATNRLTDGGPVATDEQGLWTCSAGFTLASLPAEADLRGTQILSKAPRFAAVKSVWPGLNYGASARGFTNNAALGGLVLDGAQYSQFVFSGTGPSNALYVDYLEFRNYATNFATSLSINSNMTLYFAAANLPVEQLDGQFGGRLRWVRDYVGQASLKDVVLPDGTVIQVNASVLTSTTLDSDGDGVVNGLDASPFDGVTLSTQSTAGATNFILSWTGAAQTVYYVESSTGLQPPQWTPLITTTNSASSNVVMTVQQAIPAESAQRYFRVRYTP